MDAPGWSSVSHDLTAILDVLRALLSAGLFSARFKVSNFVYNTVKKSVSRRLMSSAFVIFVGRRDFGGLTTNRMLSRS